MQTLKEASFILCLHHVHWNFLFILSFDFSVSSGVGMVGTMEPGSQAARLKLPLKVVMIVCWSIFFFLKICLIGVFF